MRTAAMASAALRRMVLASSRPSILSRAVSAGPVVSRRLDLSVHHHPVSRPFPLAFDLYRGYAGGHGGRVPNDEDESDDLDGEETMDEDEIWDDWDGSGEGKLDDDELYSDSEDSD